MLHRPRRRPLALAWIAAVGLLAPQIAVGAPAVASSPRSVEGEADAPQPPSPASPSVTATAAPSSPAPNTSPSPSTPDAGSPEPSRVDADASMEGLIAPSEDTDDKPPGPVRHPPVPSEAEATAVDDDAAADYFRQLYRPAANPGRFTAVPRLTYTVLGSVDGTISGRTSGLSVDLGQSWNTIGYAITLTANLGDINLRADDKVKSAAMLGGGPTLNLGRLALLQRGYLDLRGGYDFFYAPAYVPRGVTDPTVVAQAIAPHGPRLQIHMGLMLNPGRVRRTFQGVGVTVGYQALVGSFVGGRMPLTSVMMFGLSYWIG